MDSPPAPREDGERHIKSCCWHRCDSYKRTACDNHHSMRRFLEDDKVFEWPDDGLRQELHYNFSADRPIRTLITWQRPLIRIWFQADIDANREDYKSKSTVSQYQALERERDRVFKYPFAMKRSNYAANKPDEVSVMAGLIHPHVSALLGTCSSDGYLHLLTFPAGCCDLRDFMRCVSDNLKGVRWRPPKSDLNECEQSYLWPFEIDHVAQRQMLRKYFLCLSQALEYLHSDQIRVRHKDIKPENIVIDLYGNVILTDFDLSTKFSESNKQMVTNDISTRTTPMYAPPEYTPNDDRDAQSDVWLLGCVFLEMVTVVLGRTLDDLRACCSTALDMARRKVNYADNIDGIYRWLDELSQASSQASLSISRETLSMIKKMLSSKKDDRPAAKELWRAFDFPDQGKCPDCHPGAENDTNRWRATELQHVRSAQGLALRQQSGRSAQAAIQEVVEDQTTIAVGNPVETPSCRTTEYSGAPQQESQSSNHPGPEQTEPTNKVRSNSWLKSRRSKEATMTVSSITSPPRALASVIGSLNKKSQSPERRERRVSFVENPLADQAGLNNVDPSEAAPLATIDNVRTMTLPRNTSPRPGKGGTPPPQHTVSYTTDHYQGLLNRSDEPPSPRRTDRIATRPGPPLVARVAGIVSIAEEITSAARPPRRPSPRTRPPLGHAVLVHFGGNIGLYQQALSEYVQNNVKFYFEFPKTGHEFSILVQGTSQGVIQFKKIEEEFGTKAAEKVRQGGLWIMWEPAEGKSIALLDVAKNESREPTI